MENISRQAERKYIDAEEFKAYMWKGYKTVDPELTDAFWLYTTKRLTENLCRDIDEFPAADVRPVVRSCWEEVPDGGYVCHECRSRPLLDGSEGDALSHFCPNCGADMRKDEHNG